MIMVLNTGGSWLAIDVSNVIRAMSPSIWIDRDGFNPAQDG